jgi:glycosyltransferase involved in cell wall biosynthesis
MIRAYNFFSRQRVVVQTFTVPMSVGFLEGQAAFWQQHGYQLHLISSNLAPLPRWVADAQISKYQVPFRRRDFSLLADAWCLALLVGYFLKIRPLVVHGNTPKAAFLSILAAWFTRVPVRIYEMHGLPLETAQGWKRYVFEFLEKWTCGMATEVIAVSDSLREAALTHQLTKPHKIKVMHQGTCNGVDAQLKFNPATVDMAQKKEICTRWGIKPQHKIVGFVGRLTSEKGLNELYEAWQSVKIKHPEARLFVIGTPDERTPPAQDSLQKLHADDTIWLTGQVENVAVYYELMQFLVLPSHREGFGNVVIEAAAMQKPAVVTQVTGLKNAVQNQKTGLFCEVKNHADLAEKMLFYLQNPAMAQMHGQAARQRAIHDFSPSDVWIAKLQCYERLIARAGVLTLQHVPPSFQTAH